MATTTLTHPIATREEWLKQRVDLLKAEKEVTRASDELARRRQQLPWVKVEKDYRFETCQGEESLKDLFRGRSQLIVYHLMFGPDFTGACPSCSSIADGFNGIWEHLANHDVMLWAVSRAPYEKLQAYKKRMGWTFRWASSSDTSFNFDYDASYTPEQQRDGIEYNYRREPPSPSLASEGLGGRDLPAGGNPVGQVAAMAGTDVPTFTRERPGMSSFVLEDGAVFHTYSAYARGLDGLWNMYQWLDRAPKGRNESSYWLRRRDEYPTAL